MNRAGSRKIISLIGLFGIILYVVLYVVATKYYSGGSNTDKAAIGFDWANNYWCELISPLGKNGQVNQAYPMAIAAAIVLFVSLSAFWMSAPFYLIPNPKLAKYTSLLGVGSMIFAISMLSGQYHDLLISIAGALGVTAIIILLYYLYKTNHRGIFWLGIFCVILCVINNYVYYTGHFLNYLPIIQKISFLFFLGWFWLVLGKVKSQK